MVVEEEEEMVVEERGSWLLLPLAPPLPAIIPDQVWMEEEGKERARWWCIMHQDGKEGTTDDESKGEPNKAMRFK